MENNVNLKKYVIIFVISSIIFSMLFNLLDELLNFHTSVSSFISIDFGAAIYTSYKFVELNNRVPNNFEKNRLILFSIITSWSILIIFTLLSMYALGDPHNQLDKLKKFKTFFPAIIIIIVLQYFVFSLSYGYFAKKRLEALDKKRSKNK